jgi:hypothetical protein
MFPTKSDLAYWAIKNEPKWASKIENTKYGRTDHKLPLSTSIDDVVNAHAVTKDTTRPKTYVIPNTINILLSYRRREGEVAVMRQVREMALAPACINGEIRSAFCNRLIRRYESKK